jgi:hypothetical protein
MRGAIMASGARPRSAVELLIERLVPFEQRPPSRPIVQSYEIHRGVARSPFLLYSGALPTPFVEFGCLREERIKKLLSRSMVPHHSAASMCSAMPSRCGHGHGVVDERELFYVHPPNPREGARFPAREVNAPPCTGPNMLALVSRELTRDGGRPCPSPGANARCRWTLQKFPAFIRAA